MKKLLLAALVLLLSAGPGWAADDVKEVEAAVEHMRQAMLSRDRAELEKIPHPELIYIHSGGNVENAKQFVDALVAKNDEYLKVAFNNQKVFALDTSAVVSHIFDVTATAKTVNDGKPYDVHIGVMQVWKKEAGAWKLFARRAFLIPF
jgi:ketosteroid isomerase-like protein